jgi:hypothetical protein
VSSGRFALRVVAALLALGSGPAAAGAAAAAGDEEAPYYFYHGLTYGSEAMVQPLRMIINSGYGIMQLDNRSHALGRRLPPRLAHARPQFIRSRPSSKKVGRLLKEVVPFSTNTAEARHWPNYTQHHGGGMSYQSCMSGSAGTLSAAAPVGDRLDHGHHVLNEVAELDNYDG